MPYKEGGWIMLQTVRTADLALMTEPERQAALGEMMRAVKAPVNGYASILAARLREFERRYEISSRQLIEQLKAGTRNETADIARWLMLLQVQRRLQGDG